MLYLLVILNFGLWWSAPIWIALVIGLSSYENERLWLETLIYGEELDRPVRGYGRLGVNPLDHQHNDSKPPRRVNPIQLNSAQGLKGT